MWMMSVRPRRNGHGTPSRAALVTMLAAACGACRSRSHAPTPGRAPVRRATPSRMASFRSRPVSSAMPNRPGRAPHRRPPTSRRTGDLEVVNQPGAIGGDRRDEPALHEGRRARAEADLHHVRAEPQTIGAPSRRARVMASTTARRSAPASRRGASRASRHRGAGATGVANSSTRTLLGRDASG